MMSSGVNAVKIACVSMLLFFLSLLGVAGPVIAQQLSGIGVALEKKEDSFEVSLILENSPASASGMIQIGDDIIEVVQEDGSAVSVQNMKMGEVIELIRGPKGTPVRLTIVPSGKNKSHARVITIIRGELEQLSKWGDGNLLTKGDKAPNISWLKLKGQGPEQLSDFSGKVRVLEFWATWCGPCQPIMDKFQTYLETYENWHGKVIVITASVDKNPAIAAKHVKEKGWEQTHHVWVESDALKAYHINAIPTIYIINQKGIIVSTDHKDLVRTVNSLIKEQ